jgi:hypothetical protein
MASGSFGSLDLASANQCANSWKGSVSATPSGLGLDAPALQAIWKREMRYGIEAAWTFING